MKRATFIVLCVGGLVFAAALIGLLFFSWRPATLRIAVGPPGSDDVKVVQEIAQAFARERHYVRLRVAVTAGAEESATAIGHHEADLAVVRADLGLSPDALSVAIFRKNLVVLWLPNGGGAKGQKKESSITKVANLAGRKVGIIGKTQANVDLLKIILTESGVAPDKVEMVQFGTTDLPEALRNQKVDAFMAVGPIDSKITADAIAATTKPNSAVTFLPIDAAEIVARKHPVYESAEIAAGALGATPARPDDDVTTIDVNHLIVARKTLSELTVTAFTKQLFAIRHSLQSDFPGVANIQVPDTDKAAAIPAHPGAAAYIDGNERSFLDRYGDFMWFGLMILSGLASGGAWLRSYMRRDERIHNTELRNRLVDMIVAARESGSITELDLMQKEADEILRDTLNCFEDGAVAEDTLSAFNIALDQFHNAVADRKAWIADPVSSRRRSAAV
ncbi:MAG: TAXI family TRAP transporter solute-binding subunit [Bradyrhizobium sp.]|uniref:TAXI family TRAP transporter solute-binding subunit n=1 Tax=Bradyrhizobium sp. TaxID=376 RepID=UPI0012279194|nr:TAXI family TRAP transporter solute-binding subunit [Bradyrhizobium sp.]THD71491.1 MAG: TAXI family TRAP transporter solute-binding subunit [Bradyrhizobium sp.]